MPTKIKKAIHVSFDPPSEEEVRDACIHREYPDWACTLGYAREFIDHYGAVNWTRNNGKTPITSWPGALGTYHKYSKEFKARDAAQVVKGPKITEYDQDVPLAPVIARPEPHTNDAAQRFADKLLKP